MLAVIYCRFSDRRDSEHCQSNEAQLDFCRAYCAKQGHAIAFEFLDDAVSGAEEDRPVLWDAIAALKRGMVLVVYKSDRLARNVYLHELIYREVAKRKATIEVVEGCRNGDSAEDELVRTIFAAFAAYERKIIAARTKAAVLRQQANGFAMSKEPPYGKAVGPVVEDAGKLRRTWIDDPFEQDMIRAIEKLSLGGEGLRTIARRLNENGIAARGGGKWSHVAVGRILRRLGHNSQSGTKTVAQDAPGIAPTGRVDL